MDDSLPPVSPVSPGVQPISSSPANAPLLKVQQDTDQRYDVASMREVFDIPCQHWRDIAEIPQVRQALAAFPSELQTRPKGRLDLVSWVATMSAFGVDGPSDDDWKELFMACCFEPHKLCEAKIAVLLATAKCTSDLSQDRNVSDHVLTKMRVRPAVEGRIQARAPGILLQVQRKYDQFLYTSLQKLLLEKAIRDIDPESILLSTTVQDQQCGIGGPGSAGGMTSNGFSSFAGGASGGVVPSVGPGGGGDIGSFALVNSSFPPPGNFAPPHHNQDFVGSTNPAFSFKADSQSGNGSAPGRRVTGDFIRHIAEIQVDAQMKIWECSMMRLLRLNPAIHPQSNSRLRRFYSERELYRSHLRESVCNKFSMYILDSQRYTL